jgi:NADH:ubiquinone oxidoreductase subunit E
MGYKQYILVCGGTACESSQGIALFGALKKAVEEHGLVNDVQVVRTGCLGFCEKVHNKW